MIIDTHTHIADAEKILNQRENRLRRDNAAKRIERMLSKTVERLSISSETDHPLNKVLADSLADWVAESQLDKIILLALDHTFDEKGELLAERTTLHVDNDFVCGMVEQRTEFLFGASVHPYRADALKELERVIRKDAKLIKWIPSAQLIDPENKKCMPFYEMLAHYDIPLLTHTGVEHALGIRGWPLNHPRKLLPALKAGVKVIAAHCGTRLFLHEPSFFKSWSILAREHEHLYGDTAAFSVMTRIPDLKYALKDDVLKTKLLYGSDFPGMPTPKWCWQLGVRQIAKLSRIENPLERNIQVMRRLGMPEEVFENAEKILRIPATPKKVI